VLYGHPVTLSGRISTRQAGSRVSIYSHQYGTSTLRRIHIVTTGTGGRYTLKAAPSIATSYQARWGTAHSRTLMVGVQPRLSITEAGDGWIWAHVEPAAHFPGRSLELQQLSGGVWKTTARKQVRSNATAIFAPLATGGQVRIAFSVNQAGAGFLGSTSHALLYRAYAVTLVPQSFKVLWGKSVELAGRVQNGKADETITIESWPYGHSAPVRVADVATIADGRWLYRARPTIGTSYEAILDKAQTSTRVMIGVEPLVSVSELADGKVLASVTAGRSFSGRQVKLQQLSNHAWRTVAQMRLNSHSEATFAVPLTTSTIRVAFSVNEAGKGYLGGTSHTLAYHGHALSIALSTFKVRYGDTLTVRGRMANGKAGAHVTVTAWPYGASSPHRVATATTGANGTWSVVVKPSIRTSYSATSGLTASPQLTVGVEPALSIAELADGNVLAHVSAVRPLRGRTLQLQRRMPGGTWQTIDKRPIEAGGTVLFKGAIPTARLRAALSVNQAGVGLLGAFSPSIAYQAT
jgi:hypothetical protein